MRYVSGDFARCLLLISQFMRVPCATKSADVTQRLPLHTCTGQGSFTGNRDPKTHKILPNDKKYPHGMRWLSDQLHGAWCVGGVGGRWCVAL